MKKLIALLLAVALCLCLVACTADTDSTTNAANTNPGVNTRLHWVGSENASANDDNTYNEILTTEGVKISSTNQIRFVLSEDTNAPWCWSYVINSDREYAELTFDGANIVSAVSYDYDDYPIVHYGYADADFNPSTEPYNIHTGNNTIKIPTYFGEALIINTLMTLVDGSGQCYFVYLSRADIGG